jgi:hypothetical protein
MRNITKRNVEEAWQAWAASETAFPISDDGWPADGHLRLLPSA